MPSTCYRFILMRYLLFIQLVVVVFLSSCQSDTNVQLGFIYSSPETDRYVKEASYFKYYAERQGATVYVEHGNGDAAAQEQKAIELIERGVDGLALIAVNANTAAAIVRKAQEHGVKVMAYNRLIKNSELDFFVSGNNDVLGKMMVDELLRVKPSGEAIILGGDKYDRNAVELMASVKKYLKPHLESGRVSVGYETYIEEWSKENAAYELDQYISNTGRVPDLIFAGFDGIAAGCIEVLKKHNVDKEVFISGQDATLEGVRNIMAGHQQMTAFHPLKKTSEQAAAVMLQLVAGKQKANQLSTATINNGQKEVPVLQIPSVAITRDNLEQVLVDEMGFYTRQEVSN
ncbi:MULTISPECIES: substrate-binding domain-containing protein [unclassified Carboxylicivirga]|uniref:substrate-binding domain-containing protein n=1 Tax=Carboxylicivirga TaxID=1628153 RepID=UPI003D32778B